MKQQVKSSPSYRQEHSMLYKVTMTLAAFTLLTATVFLAMVL